MAFLALIFYINIPFGILSIMLFQMNYDETIEKRGFKSIIPALSFGSLAVLALLTGFLWEAGKRLGRKHS